MRSEHAPATEDRTTKARIRDAAITLFAEQGVAATSVRAIAAEADVSPALVIHHFRSKDALRVACDQYMADVLREQKTDAMRAGASFDMAAALRTVRDGPPLMRYLARTLVDGSPHVAEMVDRMVDDGVKYTAEGVESGMLLPTAYPYERTVVLTIWSLGALVLHEHLERLIGVNLADWPGDDLAGAVRYIGPVFEIMSQGLVDPEIAAQMKAAFVKDDDATTTDDEEDGS